MDYDFWITMGTAAILASIKNPDKRLALKKVMLKLISSIKTAYAGDPDFQ
ncbi:MAG TPA: hypothetical protein VL329_04640 [Nitrospiraceae bacterium]|jgi:hypothetical protein|nr:hypothetical protein [Nitrospiraceae bacterium]